MDYKQSVIMLWVIGGAIFIHTHLFVNQFTAFLILVILIIINLILIEDENGKKREKEPVTPGPKQQREGTKMSFFRNWKISVANKNGTLGVMAGGIIAATFGAILNLNIVGAEPGVIAFFLGLVTYLACLKKRGV